MAEEQVAPARLKAFSNAMIYPTGLVGLRIETDQGIGDIAFSVPEIGDMFEFLAKLADAHAQTFARESRPESQPYLTPIPAKGIGFQESQRPDHTLIVIQISGIALGFELENSALAAMPYVRRREAKGCRVDC